MLGQEEFATWCRNLDLSQPAKQLIETIRSSPPSRRVQGGRGNVSGNYPSLKMGVTIQFESHQCELARIYELEQDSDVLEYYDQPSAIELIYQAKSGRSNRHRYTPDFFILRSESAGWEECKPLESLKKLSEKSPNRYMQDETGCWRCPPAEEYANRFGLSFNVWSDDEVSWIFQDNCIWLDDYLRSERLSIDQAAISQVMQLLEHKRYTTLAELLEAGLNADDIYGLIATQQIYVDLNTARLSQPAQVMIFESQEIATAYANLQTVSSVELSSALNLIQIEPGVSLLWDGHLWEVVNPGNTSIGLLRRDDAEQFIELPNKVFYGLIQKGSIVAPIKAQSAELSQGLTQILTQARPKDIEEANQRYECIQEFLGEGAKNPDSSTLRRWIANYQRALSQYGNGYVGLFPKHAAKGNREARLEEVAVKFMDRFISDNYETIKNRGKLRTYEAFQLACEQHEPIITPPSFKRFLLQIKRRSGYKQTKKRQGHRAALQEKPFNWVLDLKTPRHGSRPFEIVHIDHTQLDVELISSVASLATCSLAPEQVLKAQKLGRPWVTFMVDAYSRRLLGVYLSFEEPSYRACMMVLRICVQRFQRFPQSLVVDNGAEFHSNYFEQLLASFACTKKNRPPAHARFGSVVERLFGTANTEFIYELRGNTQLSRLHRQVTKSVKPENQAIWTISDLYEALCKWAYELYDRCDHPALGQSPRTTFNQGLILGGKRLHRRVAYDESFRILTLPAPEREKRKVQPGRGIKINGVYYWSNEFRNPEIEKTLVDVRYEPFDVGIAYAFVNGKWTQCIADDYQHLQGRSEKEIKLISAELRKRRRSNGNMKSATTRELVQFLNSIEAKEAELLKQRLKASENKTVSDLITGKTAQTISQNSSQPNQPPKLRLVEPEESSPSNLEDKNQQSASLECYGEF